MVFLSFFETKFCRLEPLNTELLVCVFFFLGDCHNEYGDKDMCVSGAINNFTSQLTSFQLPLDLAAPYLMTKHDHPNHYNLTEAILFLAHFVGDIHQTQEATLFQCTGINASTICTMYV
jgi:hypothetical protein